MSRSSHILILSAVLLAVSNTVGAQDIPVGKLTSYDCTAQTDIPVLDCEGLVALYNSTDGGSWVNNSGWLEGSPCSWHGVECLVFGQFYNLFLVSNNLGGSLPPEIGNLSQVLNLTLQDNSLSGSIPEELGNLPNLSLLFLNHNQLTGVIPASFGNLSNLTGLYLGSNSLTGSIPVELGNLTKLEALDLSANSLTGPIPIALGDLSRLRYISLNRNNQLSGTVAPSVARVMSQAIICRTHEFHRSDNRELCMASIPVFQLPSYVCDLPSDPDCEPILDMLSPEDSATDLSSTQSLRWTTYGGRPPYEFQVSADEDFENIVFEGKIQGHELVEFVAPVAERTYLWRVRTHYGGRYYKWAGPRVFTVGATGPLAVSLQAPSHKATNQSKVLDFSWTSAPEAVLYHHQVSEREDFATIAVDESSLESTSYRAVGLTGGKTYFWRAAGVDTQGRKTWSQTRSFTTVVDAPSPITLISPEDEKQHVPRKTAFSWTPHAAAGTYQLQVASDAGFANIVFNDSANAKTTSTAPTPLEYGTTYYWRVRGRNAGGNGAWSETRTFTTILATPETISLVSPEDKKQHVSRLTSFSWQPNAAAGTYQLQLATDAAFANVVLNDSANTKTSSTVASPLEYGTAYYWRVRGRNAGGDGAWSEVRVFTTVIAASGAIALLNPEDGAAEVMAYTTFSWEALKDVATYHLQVGGDAAFSAPFVNDSSLTDATYAVSEPLAYSTTYNWHVRAALDDGLAKSAGLLWGPWSEIRSFTIAVGTATEGGEGVPNSFALHPSYPNPFNPSTTLTYDLPQAANVKLVVFDGLGRVVESLVNSHQSLGRHTVTWGARGMPSGVYFVRMVAGNFTQTRRMILTK